MLLDESYNADKLRTWIRETLGGRVWRLEGLDQNNAATLDAAISAAVMRYSKEVPRFAWEEIPAGITSYTIKTKPIFGVIRVDFIEPYNSYGMGASGFGLIQNLTGVVTPPILSGGGVGAADIQQFMTWRKSFQRVTSRRPDYRYDDTEGVLFIYNPVAYKACAMLSQPRNFDQIRLQHKNWLARMSLAEAKINLGQIRSKYTISGPGGKDIDLQGKSLKDEGIKERDDCVKELEGFRLRGIPSWD